MSKQHLFDLQQNLCWFEPDSKHIFCSMLKIAYPFVQPRFMYLLGLFLSTLHQPSKLKSLESELIQPKRETIWMCSYLFLHNDTLRQSNLQSCLTWTLLACRLDRIVDGE
jgi:hypothetical protein